MKQTSKIPDFLKERRSRRVLITIWFGLIPLIMGCVGLYNYFTKKEKTYKGTNFKISYKIKCGNEIILNNCLFVIIGSDTLKTSLSAKELDIYNESYSKRTDNSIIEVVYLENIIQELKINDQLIIKYKSALWWGILFVAIGFFWIGIHIRFFIKDPFNKYSELKDPFNKFKR